MHNFSISTKIVWNQIFNTLYYLWKKIVAFLELALELKAGSSLFLNHFAATNVIGFSETLFSV